MIKTLKCYNSFSRLVKISNWRTEVKDKNSCGSQGRLSKVFSLRGQKSRKNRPDSFIWREVQAKTTALLSWVISFHKCIPDQASLDWDTFISYLRNWQSEWNLETDAHSVILSHLVYTPNHLIENPAAPVLTRTTGEKHGPHCLSVSSSTDLVRGDGWWRGWRVWGDKVAVCVFTTWIHTSKWLVNIGHMHGHTVCRLICCLTHAHTTNSLSTPKSTHALRGSPRWGGNWQLRVETWHYWWHWQQFKERTPVRDFMRWGDKVCLQINCCLPVMSHRGCQNTTFFCSTCLLLSDVWRDSGLNWYLQVNTWLMQTLVNECSKIIIVLPSRVMMSSTSPL